jgi:aspartate aminotransferase
MIAPLEDLDRVLPPHVLAVARRDTPIPTLAERAKATQERHPELVRADIGQVIGVDPALEVLYGPPVGLEPLRAAVAELYRHSFGLEDLVAGNVAICSGAAEGLALAFACFGSDRDVGLPRGHWENYRNGVDLARGRAHVVDFFDAAGRFDPQALARQIGALNLAALVANFPCNPTGAVLNAEETAQLARVAVDTSVVLIADEVYARLRYDGQPPQSLLAYAPGHAVSIGSASKEYLLPGGRIGYLVSTQRDLIDRVFRRLIRANTASPNVLGQQRLLALLERDLEDVRAGRPPGLIERIRTAMKERRDALLEVLARHGLPHHGRRPEGTIFLMAQLPPWFEGDDVAFANAALDAHCFSCIPGSAFGLPGCVRLSFGATRLDDIARLDTQLARWRGTL